ncbi:SLAIN motif-containing protein 1a [Brachionichthys hirsutus]|uniref:SLAIN motif-containing protein 1a n=1 Tax=Brachionichthys hirsutus TaxID=412623 RepID=UPI003604F7F3
MEAEVLNPQMVPDVNGNGQFSSAELEVLKLQELVRKLEQQNEQLRTRANAVNNCPVGPLLRPPSCLHGGASSPTQTHPCAPGRRVRTEEPFAYFQPSAAPPEAAGEDSVSAGLTNVLDDVDVVDLSVALPVEEPDSWLYVSPKAKLLGESALSPLRWCRRVLDHPGPEVQLAKMTLCHRLDQAKRRRGMSSIRPYSCIEAAPTLSWPLLPYAKPAALTESPGQRFLQPTLPPRPSRSLGDRAPTFLSNSTLHSKSFRHAALSPPSSLDSEAGLSELEDDSVSTSYKLQDMTDVEVMARLQEESLRQDYASTAATASRRSSSFSLHSLRRSNVDLEEEDEEEEEDEGYDQLPPPQPKLFRAGSMQRGSLPHSHTFSSMRDCRRNAPFSLSGLSQCSVPSGPMSETHTAYGNSTDTLRRSMPNLIRAPSMSSVPSMPCLASPVNPPSHGPSSLPTIAPLRSSRSFDSSNGLAQLQSSILSSGQLSQRVQSVGSFLASPRHPLKATAYVSPTVQQGPTSLPTSISLHSIPSSAALPHPLKPCSSSVPQPLKSSANQSAVPRRSLPRLASFVGTSGVPRSTKFAQPTRSLLAPPKSLAALSALRDGSWKDGCY